MIAVGNVEGARKGGSHHPSPLNPGVGYLRTIGYKRTLIVLPIQLFLRVLIVYEQGNLTIFNGSALN